MNELEIKVNGMVCEGCENRIKNAISLIDGMESVNADYKTGTVTILANKEIDKLKIEEKIEDIGFEIVKGN